MPLVTITVLLGAGGVIFAAGEGDGLPAWAQVVIVIGIAFGLITKQLVPGWIYTDMKNRLDATEAEVKDAHQKLIDVYATEAPALKEAQRVVADAMTELRLYRTLRAEGREGRD